MSKLILRPLTIEEEEKLYKTLLNAFDADSFERMLRFKLGKNLDHFVGPDAAFRTVVFEIVKIANREGWLNDLIAGAAAANPGNSQLDEFVNSIVDPDSVTSEEDVEPQEEQGEYSAKALRKMLTGPHGVTLSDLKEICFELDVEFENLQGGRDDRVLDLIRFLAKQGKLQALIDLLKRDYPHTLGPVDG